MIRGLYTSALGMTTQMNVMNVLADNIANVNTTGHKRDFVVTRSFTEEYMRLLDDPSQDMFHDYPIGKVSQGLFVDDIYTDFSSGGFKQTDAPLDLAIAGEGFFVVNTTDKDGKTVEKYTRDGGFTLNANNTLVAKTGEPVQGERGNIVIPNGNIFIDERGRVYSGETFIDTIKVVDFKDKHLLRKQSDNYLTAAEGAEKTTFTGKLEQGFLEGSNVNPVSEMIKVIAMSRTYEANSKMLQTHDTLLGRSVTDIARR